MTGPWSPEPRVVECLLPARAGQRGGQLIQMRESLPAPTLAHGGSEMVRSLCPRASLRFSDERLQRGPPIRPRGSQDTVPKG